MHSVVFFDPEINHDAVNRKEALQVQSYYEQRNRANFNLIRFDMQRLIATVLLPFLRLSYQNVLESSRWSGTSLE